MSEIAMKLNQKLQGAFIYHGFLFLDQMPCLLLYDLYFLFGF